MPDPICRANYLSGRYPPGCMLVGGGLVGGGGGGGGGAGMLVGFGIDMVGGTVTGGVWWSSPPQPVGSNTAASAPAVNVLLLLSFIDSHLSTVGA
jgi:hypothetical protein